MIYLMMIESQEDRSKFEILYEKYRYLMYSDASDILKDVHLAEDAVHDAFVKIAKNMHKIGEVDAKETKNYIMVITRNTALDAYRKRARSIENEVSVTEMEESVVYSSESSIDSDADEITENEVLNIIRNMPDVYKNVFLLKYVNGLTNSEIAEQLDVTEATIRKRISRGRDIIEKAIEGKRVQ